MMIIRQTSGGFDNLPLNLVDAINYISQHTQSTPIEQQGFIAMWFHLISFPASSKIS